MADPSKARSARARTYTTVAPPNLGNMGGVSSPTAPGGVKSPSAKQSTQLSPARNSVTSKGPVKKHGVYPEPKPATRPCSCDPVYLKTRFCLPGHPNMNFHERFFACQTCSVRPVQHLCCKCWRGYCKKHAQDHYGSLPEHHIYANYELWQYEECFTCLKCNGYAMNDAFDAVLEPLFMSKGSFVPQPVTEKHVEYFEDHGVRVGAATMQGWRADNEDSHVIYLGLPHSGADYFAVYDGHGGPFVARYAGNKVHMIFDKLASTGADYPTLLTKAFLALDEGLLKDTTSDESGSTGCTANVVVVNHQTKKVYCANAGDARSVMCRNGKAIDLSIDHRPNVDSERARIYAAGSIVSEDARVEGLLAVSRAFGDFDFKQASSLPPQKQAVTCNPEVLTFDFTPDDSFIVVACDGIWDCLTSQEVVTFLSNALKVHGDPQKACVQLLDKIVPLDLPEDGLGTDNMSIILALMK